MLHLNRDVENDHKIQSTISLTEVPERHLYPFVAQAIPDIFPSFLRASQTHTRHSIRFKWPCSFPPPPPRTGTPDKNATRRTGPCNSHGHGHGQCHFCAGCPVKPTVVLVHGAFADSSSWNSVVKILEKMVTVYEASIRRFSRPQYRV